MSFRTEGSKCNSDGDIDTIVKAVLAQYVSCSFRPSSSDQFTILAAFILHAPSDLENKNVNSRQTMTKVAALATGAKCLPTSSYASNGDALHDSHAEVLARRALRRWISEELKRITQNGSSPWLRHTVETNKWRLCEGVEIYLYVSAVPCGDASMRLLASMQDPTVAALKDSAPPVVPAAGTAARGRDGYSLRGVLRTKPGRADAPPTMCMSCSDKIASWNVLGLQGALLSEMLEPIYISGVILGGVPDELRTSVREDCERAFHGRLAGVKGDLPSGFQLYGPKIYFTDVEFAHSREALLKTFPKNIAPTSSNDSLCWIADSARGQEVVINGLRRGTSAKLRALGKNRPHLCKLQLFQLHADLRNCLRLPEYPPDMTYYKAKTSSSTQYQTVRSMLKGPGSPFSGWVVSGQPWESFELSGNIKE